MSEEGSEKIKVPIIDERWDQPIMCGYMNKFSKIVFKKSYWSKRYFILNKSGSLWYFGNDNPKSKPKKDRPINVKNVRFWKSNYRRDCLKIEKLDKPFYFYFDSTDEMEKWVTKLCEAGGVFCGELLADSYMAPQLSSKSVKDWTSDHIIDWLSFLPFPKEDDAMVIYKDHFKGVDGKRLIILNDKKIHEMGINHYKHRLFINQGIRYLKRMKKFDVDFHTVLKKILLATRGMKGRIKIHQQYAITKNLSDASDMRKIYLTEKYMNNWLPEEVFDHTEESEGEQEEEESEYIPKLLELQESPVKEGDSLTSGFKPQLRNKLGDVSFPIRLVVSEMPTLNTLSTCEEFLSPKINQYIMKSHPSQSEDPMVLRNALVLGPWYFEWNESGLVIPKYISNVYKMYIKDVEIIGIIELMNDKIDEFLETLTNFICSWNTKKSFDRQLCNGQHFIEDLLRKVNHNSALPFKDMKSQGGMYGSKEHGFKMPISNEFRKIFHIREKDFKMVHFKTHKELDWFTFDLQNIDVIAFRMDTQLENSMMGSIDRAFWMRRFKNPNAGDYLPATSNDDIICPFNGRTSDINNMFDGDVKKEIFEGMKDNPTTEFHEIHYHKHPFPPMLPDQLRKGESQNIRLHPSLCVEKIRDFSIRSVLYFGAPHHKFVATVDSSPNHRHFRIYKYDEKSSHLGSFEKTSHEDEDSQIDTPVRWDDERFLLSYYNSTTGHGVIKMYQISTGKLVRDVMKYTLETGLGVGDRVAKINEDVFVVHGVHDLLICSFQEGKILRKIRNEERFSGVVSSKHLKNHVLVISKEEVQIVDCEQNEEQKKEVVLELESGLIMSFEDSRKIYKDFRSYCTTSFLNPRNQSEEIVVLGGANHLVFLGINHISEDNIRVSSRKVEVDDSTARSMFIIDNEYLCVSDGFGYVFAYHVSCDSISDIGQEENIFWTLECDEMMSIRHHYLSIECLVPIGGVEEEKLKILTCSGDKRMTVTLITGLKLHGYVEEEEEDENSSDSDE